MYYTICAFKDDLTNSCEDCETEHHGTTQSPDWFTREVTNITILDIVHHLILVAENQV